jgi:maltose O-acetyltransferase
MAEISGATEQTAMPLYRPQGGLRPLKQAAVKLISTFWARYYRIRFRDRVQFGRNFRTNGKLVIKGPGRIVIGDDVNAWAHAENNVLITYTPDSLITIGSGTRLNGAGLMAYTRIEVGPRCILGSTLLFDSDFHPLEPEHRHDTDLPVRCAPIVLDENVWLGGQSAVLKGVHIGRNSVVAFRAVVTADVPPDVVVAGNPARIVKELG